MDIPSVAQQISKRRIAAGLSPQQLADKAGIHRNTVVKVESGKCRQTSLFVFVALAKAFGIGLEELVYGDPPKKSA